MPPRSEDALWPTGRVLLNRAVEEVFIIAGSRRKDLSSDETVVEERGKMAFGKASFALAVVLAIAVTVWPQDPHLMDHMATHDTNWEALMKNMETMNAAMIAVEPSGNNDADFVNVMLPHHQAAVDMARTELLYGSDPQMRRLAQEIITDQESEIQLMQLWLDRQRFRTKDPSHLSGSGSR